MFKRARQGIATDEETWLDEVIDRAGPAGNFIAESSTVRGIRGGEWLIPDLGLHDTFEGWVAAGRPTLLQEACDRVDHILATHKSLPLGEEVDRELKHIQSRATVQKT